MCAQIIPFKNWNPDQEEIDVCIIGAGPIGLSIASRLSNSNLNCIVLESGQEQIGDAQSLTEGINAGLKYFPLDEVRTRAVGGTTHIWGGNSAPLQPIDFEKKDYIPYSGWPISYNEYSRYISDASSLLALSENWDQKHNLDEFIEDNESLFFDWKLYQYSPSIVCSSDRCKGNFYTYNKAKIKNDIIFDATVFDYKFDTTGQIVSVKAKSYDSSKVNNITAKIFILACGGIENARQLLMIEKVKGNPLSKHVMIGKCFMEHPHVDIGKMTLSVPLPNDLTHFGFVLKEAIGAYRPFLKSNILINNKLSNVNFQIIKRKKDNVILRGLFEQAPNPNSRVELSDNKKDDLGQPLTKLNYDLYDFEYKNYFKAAIFMARELGARGLARVKFTCVHPKDFDKRKNFLGGGHHHMGTTRMAASVKTGVVDKNCKVFGTENLYVAGASVFPTSGSVNPTMNAIALALRTADYIIKEF